MPRNKSSPGSAIVQWATPRSGFGPYTGTRPGCPFVDTAPTNPYRLCSPERFRTTEYGGLIGWSDR